MSRYRSILLLIGFAFITSPADAFQFTPGDFYGTNYFSNTIIHYGPSGTIVDSMTVPAPLADDVRGLVFGPDSLLYAVAQRGSGFAVLALDAAGTVQQTYPFASNYIGGNVSQGKIAFDNSGDFYVAGGAGLVKFTQGNPSSGTLIRAGDTYDVEAMPSGNLLIVENYTLYELTNTGAVVQNINPIGISFTSNRGVEYDPATDRVYVTMLGHTGAFDQLMKFNRATGQLLGNTTFWYGDDMFLADDGRLIVGSSNQNPGIFTKDLAYTGSFVPGNRLFVTQYVPEPTTMGLLVTGGLLVLRRRSRRANRFTC